MKRALFAFNIYQSALGIVGVIVFFFETEATSVIIGTLSLGRGFFISFFCEQILVSLVWWIVLVPLVWVENQRKVLRRIIFAQATIMILSFFPILGSALYLVTEPTLHTDPWPDIPVMVMLFFTMLFHSGFMTMVISRFTIVVDEEAEGAPRVLEESA